MRARSLALLLPFIAACSGVSAENDPAEDALNDRRGAASTALVPETAPTGAVVLANADLFAGINELHYTMLRGLFLDRALDDVKILYLTPHGFQDMVTPVRAKDGDRLTARFATRFAAEIASGRLQRVAANVETNWPRDYFPMVLGGGTGSEKPAVRFHYDVMPNTGIAAQTAAESLGLTIKTSPIQLEGGNVLVDDDATLFTTTKIIERNAPKTKAAIESELKSALGVKEIEWLDPLPGESTGHIDIMAKVVGKKRAVVGASDGVCGADAPPTCAKRKPVLDKVAAAFTRRGYTVTRVLNADSAGDTRALTYANSLLVNGTAFVPMYFDPHMADDVAAAFEGPDVPAKNIVKECNTRLPFPGTNDVAADLVARERARCAIDGVVRAAKAKGEPTSYYEYGLEIARRDGEAKKAYESLGLRVVQVPGASMINFGGSIHCVTMQVPK